ncbi:hypothetical protein AURDEDRAFT_174773 [Auricularia subglabra TFB-10046 SS5]|uniref:NAD(P)-binding protein n=1 Tax=Auricularia subglabra (strain TFB-10046 / SS5) TaxID=717982 RepID=J0LFN2_AURST|nr:hypothetical protein AURDEDRAFT_174773 [Auricularia subglabra TFB-10046 SS5]
MLRPLLAPALALVPTLWPSERRLGPSGPLIVIFEPQSGHPSLTGTRRIHPHAPAPATTPSRVRDAPGLPLFTREDMLARCICAVRRMLVAYEAQHPRWRLPLPVPTYLGFYGVTTVQGDAADKPTIAVLCKRAVAEEGRLNVFFANAGIATIKWFGDVDPVQHERVMRVDAISVFEAIKHTSKAMLKTGKGKEVAQIALFPASGNSSFVNGQNSAINGDKMASMPVVPGKLA